MDNIFVLSVFATAVTLGLVIQYKIRQARKGVVVGALFAKDIDNPFESTKVVVTAYKNKYVEYYFFEGSTTRYSSPVDVFLLMYKKVQ